MYGRRPWFPLWVPASLHLLGCNGSDLRDRLRSAAGNESLPIPEASTTPDPQAEVQAEVKEEVEAEAKAEVEAEAKAEEVEPAAISPEPRGEFTFNRTTGGNAERVGAADLDGDGIDELILFEEQSAVVGTQRWDLGGRPQRQTRGDIDGDGDEELLVATGVGRSAPKAPVRIWAIHKDQAEIIYETNTERNQVTDLQFNDRTLFLALFVTAKEVQSGTLERGEFTPRYKAPMAMQQHLVGDQLVVGRLYGDTPKSFGDLSVISENNAARPLPSLRGVRTLSHADLDGDGLPELLVADGWHYAYGEHGDARLMAHLGTDWTQTRPLAWLPQNYSIRDIDVETIRGRTAILLTGSHDVYLLTPDGLGWAQERLGKIDETGNAVFIKTQNGPAVAISGQPVQYIELALP